jgi:Protein of unknown function (DUF3987)
MSVSAQVEQEYREALKKVAPLPKDGNGQRPPSPETQEDPLPLSREIPAAEPFPVDALGSLLGTAAVAINDRIQSPLTMCAQSVLAVATLAVQAQADVVLPISGGQAKPISNDFVCVAVTGERKTATDIEACGAIKKREKALRDGYAMDRLTYEHALVAYDEAKSAKVKTQKGDRAAIEAVLAALGPAPPAPLSPILTCEEPTYEGLFRLLVSGQPSIGIFSNEGGQFVGGHGMTEEAKLRTAAGLSKLWDGEPVHRVRGGEGATILAGRRVAMHLMMQPDVASVLLQDPVLADQGLLSRLLVTFPESTIGTRLSRVQKPENDGAIRRYGARLLAILEKPYPLGAGKQNELEPRALRLSLEAARHWQAYVDHIEGQLGSELESVRGLANKAPEHAARLAAVLTLTDDIGAGEVTGRAMEAGIELVDFYCIEGVRLAGMSKVSVDLKLAQRLLAWLQTAWPEPNISLPDIYQLGPSAIREQSTAKRIAGILEAHRWLTKIPGGAEVAGRSRKDAWAIHGKGVTQ